MTCDVRSSLRSLPRGAGSVIVAALLALGVAEPTAWAESTALELVKSARSHELAHEEDVAVRRYMEALSIDSTCEEAYLGLGGLRARTGDLREADRVYSMALEHLPGSRGARLARAHVRHALGATPDAVVDLLTSPDDEIAALKTLATWHAEDGQIPAQLAVWRLIAARAEATQQVAALREARTMVRALVILVGPADPAAAPPENRGLRHTIGLVARRGGA